MAEGIHDDFEKEFLELQASSNKRFKSIFDNIIHKYSAVPEIGRDEVDIMNLTIVKDYGQIRAMKPLPCGYFANKFRRPKKERRKINNLLKKLKKKSGPNSVSPRKHIQPGLLEKTQEKLADLKFSPKSMKIPILENSPICKKLCRDSLTSLESFTLKKHDRKNYKFQIINDLFIYKTKEAFNSKVTMAINITPRKENQIEDSLISNEYLTPKKSPSYNKIQSIEHLFKYFRASSTPRPKRKLRPFFNKQSLLTPINNTIRNDKISDIPCLKKSKLELVENKTPASNKGKAFDLSLERPTLSKKKKKLTQYSSTPRHQSKDKSSTMKQSPSRSENNTKVDGLASPDFSIIRKSKRNLANNSLEEKIATSNKVKVLNQNKKMSTCGILSKGNANIFQSDSTPRQQQKFCSSVKESSLPPKNSAKQDNVISFDFSPTKKSILVSTTRNSSEKKISTLRKCKASDLTKRKSTDSILNNKAEEVTPLKSSKNIVYGLKYVSPVTTVSHKLSPFYVMKSSPQMILEGVKEDDIVNYGNISTRLFKKNN